MVKIGSAILLGKPHSGRLSAVGLLWVLGGIEIRYSIFNFSSLLLYSQLTLKMAHGFAILFHKSN